MCWRRFHLLSTPSRTDQYTCEHQRRSSPHGTSRLAPRHQEVQRQLVFVEMLPACPEPCGLRSRASPGQRVTEPDLVRRHKRLVAGPIQAEVIPCDAPAGPQERRHPRRGRGPPERLRAPGSFRCESRPGSSPTFASTRALARISQARGWPASSPGSNVTRKRSNAIRRRTMRRSRSPASASRR